MELTMIDLQDHENIKVYGRGTRVKIGEIKLVCYISLFIILIMSKIQPQLFLKEYPNDI